MVTEGSWQHKLQAIEANSYLAHVYDRLRELDAPLVVFGSSFGEQDRHLTDALSAHPDRPAAVSMMPGPKRELRSKQAGVYERFEAKPLLFYDATTHPLGSSGLTAADPCRTSVRDAAYAKNGSQLGRRRSWPASDT